MDPSFSLVPSGTVTLKYTSKEKGAARKLPLNELGKV